MTIGQSKIDEVEALELEVRKQKALQELERIKTYNANREAAAKVGIGR